MVSCPKLCDETTTVADLRRIFLDDHVHAAVVVRERQLVSVIERGDLDAQLPDTALAAGLGSIHGRVVRPEEQLTSVHERMRRNNQRRLAVIDAEGELIGLLCLKRSLTGFCSDQNTRERMTDTG